MTLSIEDSQLPACRGECHPDRDRPPPPAFRAIKSQRGLVPTIFTKQKSNHALILRVAHPQNNGVRVKWCQITTSVPNPAVVYRASTPITPLDKFESEITKKFPPPCDEKGLRDGGLLVPYLNPGDAIISIDGISIASAFPTLEELASFIRQNCQRKMTIVALRHETVWKAALDQIITQPEGSVDSQTISKAAREAWNRVFVSCSGNQKGVKRKVMSSNSTAAQQPMPIYTACFGKSRLAATFSLSVVRKGVLPRVIGVETI